MKTKAALSVIILASAIVAHPQANVGLYSAGALGVNHANDARAERAVADMRLANSLYKQQPRQAPWRFVAGTNYNAERSVIWKTLVVDVERNATNGLVAQKVGWNGSDWEQTREYVLILNYPARPPLNARLRFRALPSGTVDIGKYTVEALDYGTAYVPTVQPSASATNSAKTATMRQHEKAPQKAQ